eukprot:COSAG01_NODE_2613_length_7380_cov_9.901525_2_plen_34_part_00
MLEHRAVTSSNVKEYDVSRRMKTIHNLIRCMGG